RELDRLDDFLAVERDGLAVGFDLLAAPRPQIRIPEAGRVAKGVAERLAEWPAFGLELFAGFAVLLPSLRELAAAIADFLEPGFAIGQQPAASSPRHADPFPADGGDEPRDVVEAALRLAHRLGHVADIGHTLGIELRPIADCIDDIGTGARLNGR